MEIVLVMHRDRSWSAFLPDHDRKAQGQTREEARSRLAQSIRRAEEKPELTVEGRREVVFISRW